MSGPRCCRDSAAMAVLKVEDAPFEGMYVECRWCDGYARYTKGDWTFSNETADRIRAMASPENLAAHNAMLSDLRGRRIASEMKKEQ